jgi:hypothetical protein
MNFNRFELIWKCLNNSKGNWQGEPFHLGHPLAGPNKMAQPLGLVARLKNRGAMAQALSGGGAGWISDDRWWEGVGEEAEGDTRVEGVQIWGSERWKLTGIERSTTVCHGQWCSSVRGWRRDRGSRWAAGYPGKVVGGVGGVVPWPELLSDDEVVDDGGSSGARLERQSLEPV